MAGRAVHAACCRPAPARHAAAFVWQRAAEFRVLLAPRSIRAVVIVALHVRTSAVDHLDKVDFSMAGPAGAVVGHHPQRGPEALAGPFRAAAAGQHRVQADSGRAVSSAAAERALAGDAAGGDADEGGAIGIADRIGAYDLRREGLQGITRLAF